MLNVIQFRTLYNLFIFILNVFYTPTILIFLNILNFSSTSQVRSSSTNPCLLTMDSGMTELVRHTFTLATKDTKQ